MKFIIALVVVLVLATNIESKQCLTDLYDLGNLARDILNSKVFAREVTLNLVKALPTKIKFVQKSCGDELKANARFPTLELELESEFEYDFEQELAATQPVSQKCVNELIKIYNKLQAILNQKTRPQSALGLLKNLVSDINFASYQCENI